MHDAEREGVDGGTNDIPVNRTPLLVEITGVAGAGKSTLTTSLLANSTIYRRADFIHTRNPIHFLYLLRSLPGLTPLLFVGWMRRPRMRWADVKLMAYVSQWSRYLERRPEYASGVILLDQGPVYSLVRLKAKGLGVGATATFHKWWTSMLQHWSSRLSVVVLLDAEDEVLQGRIDERAQAHAIKGESGGEFIRTYRSLFQQALQRLETEGDTEVIRLASGDTDAARLADELDGRLMERIEQ